MSKEKKDVIIGNNFLTGLTSIMISDPNIIKNKNMYIMDDSIKKELKNANDFLKNKLK